MKNPGLREWAGGRLTLPVYVTEGEPYRPEAIFWLELPDDFIVGATVLDPKAQPVPFAETLVGAMKAPMVGVPRRPRRVRVADERLAAELREAVPDIEVVVAPTPELDRVLSHMADSLPAAADESESYLEGGRVSADTVEQLFRAADILYRTAPWKVASDTQVLRMDIPQLGVQGACVSIIGALGESLGFVIFPSLSAYEAFLSLAEDAGAPKGPLDLGSTLLSLDFERGADLPASMRREVALHRWPVASPEAYPRVGHRDRDGLPRPLTERDVRIATACAGSLVAFFLRNRDIFEQRTFEPVCESFANEAGLTVRFTAPYEAAGLFVVEEPHPGGTIGTKPARNAPCPCGSGEKYKKCCLGKDDAARATRGSPAWLHRTEQRLVEAMIRFARGRFGERWLDVEKGFSDPEAALQLLVPWSLCHLLLEGRPLVEWFVTKRSRHLSGADREWLEAQRRAWLSVWEVTAVEPGRSVTLKDLLTGEERHVHEVSGSETLVRRDTVLARVVDHGELSVFCGVHPRALPPMDAAEVVRRTRARLRCKRAIPVERLRDEKSGRYMIARWEKAVEELDVRRQQPPVLFNTDGDELLFVTDHFDFDPAAQDELEGRLSSLAEVMPPDPGERERTYSFLRTGSATQPSSDSTIIGTASIEGAKLRLESNSPRRADALRDRVEVACKGLIRHRAREHRNPRSLPRTPTHPGAQARAKPLPEAEKLVREHKRRHYSGWLDYRLPALGGKTPREAVRTKAGRERLDLLLRHLENQESRLPEGERFDFSIIRAKLGLDP